MAQVCYLPVLYNRDRTGNTAYHNSEIQRDKLEKFVLSEISKIVFDDAGAKSWLKKYREYTVKNDESTQSRIEDMRRKSERLAEKIENIALSIAESSSSSRSLVEMIEKLEDRKSEIDKQIIEAEKLSKVVDVTEEDIRYHYSMARELFKFGELPEIRQLINLYLERVIVYREHVEVILRMLPVFYIENCYSHLSRCYFRDGVNLKSTIYIVSPLTIYLASCFLIFSLALNRRAISAYNYYA